MVMAVTDSRPVFITVLMMVRLGNQREVTDTETAVSTTTELFYDVLVVPITASQTTRWRLLREFIFKQFTSLGVDSVRPSHPISHP